MEPRNKELFEMCHAHFNEPIISFFDLVRCIGYGETAIDCYILARGRDNKIQWLTCVGGYTFLDRLKGQNHVFPSYPKYPGEFWDDFVRLDKHLELNGSPKEEKFILDLQHDDYEYHNPLNN